MQNYLAIIEYPYQVEFLKKWLNFHSQKRETTKVISLNLEASLSLEKEAIKHHKIDLFIKKDPIRSGYLDSSDLALKMEKFFNGKSFYEKALFPDYWAFFRYLLICEEVIQDLLSQHPSHCVLVFPVRRVLALLYDRQAQTEGVFDGLLRYELKKRKHSYCTLKGSILAKCKESLRLFAVLWDQMQNTVKKRGASVPLAGSRADILFADWGFDFYRHMEFEAVENSKCYDKLKLAHLVWRGITLKSKRGSLLLPVVLTYPSITSLVIRFWLQVVCQRTLFFFLKKDKRKELNYPFIFFNRHLWFSFVRFFLVSYCYIYLSKNYIEQILKSLQPKLLVCSDVDYSFHRALILLAKEHHIPVISLNHGCYDHTVFKEHFLADYLAVWGERIEKNLVESGIPKEKIKVLGNSLYSRLWPYQEWLKNGTVMILASHYADSWTDRVGAEMRYKKLIEDLCGYLCGQMKTKVILKSHPGGKDLYGFYDFLQEKYTPYFQHINRKGPFEDLLKECNLVVLPGISTTAILDCLVAKKPILFHAGVFPWDEEHLKEMGEVGRKVSSFEEFQALYAQMTQNEKLRKEIIDQGSDYLISCTCLGKNSVENLNQFVIDIFKSNLKSKNVLD